MPQHHPTRNHPGHPGNPGRTGSRGLLALTIATAAWLPAALPASAADTPAPTAAAAPAADPLAEARGQIKAGRWVAAIDTLRKVNASADADWNNLMGYAQRKQPQPDLDAAQRFYDTALKINPRHTGALEYSGELALMRGDLATAESRLAMLGQVCTTPCEPLDDLKKAVARYKASGKS